MGKIFVLMGKSATGKDTIYKHLLEQKELGLQPVVTYTTRPIREGEQEGREYHFVSTEQYQELKKEGKVIEWRDYNTVHGVWSYFTVADEQFSEKEDCLVINTLEGYAQILKFFGQEQVVPLYIQVEDGLRLTRALGREREQKEPKYQELCRRFLADCEDFSEDKLQSLNIHTRFENVEMEDCLEKVKKAIQENRSIGVSNERI